MVAVSMSEKTDLVSDNYYEQEIKYQEQIDILKNSELVDKNINVNFENNGVQLKLSNKEMFKDVTGVIYFYRTSNAQKDFKTEFKPDESGIQNIPAIGLDKGLWKVRISLDDGKNKYFVERNIFIN